MCTSLRSPPGGASARAYARELLSLPAATSQRAESEHLSLSAHSVDTAIVSLLAKFGRSRGPSAGTAVAFIHGGGAPSAAQSFDLLVRGVAPEACLEWSEHGNMLVHVTRR